MYRPNQYCEIQKVDASDIYGMPVAGARHQERCSVVELVILAEKSSVRADTSASRGSAIEMETKSKFLLSKTSAAEVNDAIIFAGNRFRIVSRFPRYNARGSFDHYEITCSYWGKE
jgi:hypothetical protein